VATLLCFLLLLSAPASAEQPADTGGPLRFGLLPFASPVSLFQRFAPLRDYLADRVGTSFELESARSFAVHVQSIEAGEYDLVLTAPHFVLIALDSGHYHLIAGHRERAVRRLRGGARRPGAELHDLAGRTIATPPPEALITMVGETQYLLRVQLGPSDRSTHLHPLSLPQRRHPCGDQRTGGRRHRLHQRGTPRDQPGCPVRILEESDRFPGVGVLAHRRLTERLRDEIAEVLITMGDRVDGSDVLRQMDYAGYQSASVQTYEQFRPILPETRRHLEPTRTRP
jgi:phosphonate transport system substrate-binding protein